MGNNKDNSFSSTSNLSLVIFYRIRLNREVVLSVVVHIVDLTTVVILPPLLVWTTGMPCPLSCISIVFLLGLSISIIMTVVNGASRLVRLLDLETERGAPG